MKSFLKVAVVVIGFFALVAVFPAILPIMLVGGLYFIPSFIALSSSKRNAAAVVALNLLLGWTVLGWVGALVWSMTQDAPPVVVVPPTVN